MKIFSAQLKGTTTVVSGSSASITGSFTGSIAGIDINATNAFTASTIARLSSIETISSSSDSRVNSLEAFSSSIFTTNTFTSSTSARLNSIETISASNISRLNSIETISASNIARLNALESTSASVDTLNTTQNSRLSSLEIKTGSLATTGSNTFIGTQTITGSLYISSDLIVQGSSSLQNITASAVSIGTNLINLNTANPAIRYAGLSIGDSGSIGSSGSFLYDSVQDEFIFVHRGTNTTVTSSVVLMGPQTYDSIGNETYLTSNRIPKGAGNEHLADSNISDTGTLVTINSVTSSFSGFVGIGTTTPVSSLHIASNTNTTLRINATANNGSAELDLLANGGQNSYIDFGPNDLRFRSTNSDMSALNNSAVLSLTNGGRVGVGTTDPGYKFHISGSSQVTSYFQTSGTYAPISWTGDNGSTKGGVIAHGGNIGIGGLNSGGTGIDGDKSLTIKSGSGFVGINTTSVNVPLVISTTGNTLDGTFYSTFTINNTTATSTSWSRIRFDRSNVAQWGVGEYDGKFRISNLYENGSVAANDTTFVIKNDNYVGIGIANPIHRLSVNGNAKFIITPGSSGDGDRVTIAQNSGTYGIDLVAYGSGAQPYSSTQGIFSWGGYDMLVMSNNANIKFVTAAYSERMRITNAGQVLMYNQPAFYAYGNTGNTGSGEYLTYPTVHVNRGGHYNASNGVFTAPVAGLYFFSWSAIGNTTNDVYRFFIRVNNTNWGGDHQLRQDTNETGSAYATNGNRNVMISLSANDTVRIYYTADAGSAFYGANNPVDNYLNFFGYLIG